MMDLKWFFVFAFFFLSRGFCQQTKSNGVRFCVLDKDLEACNQMRSDVKGTLIECVPGAGSIDCMRKIEKNEADVVSIGGPDVYIAGKNFSIEPLIQEFIGNDSDFRYEGVAVVRANLEVKSLNDLRGKKSCYTGYGRNAGWKIPVAQLLGLQDRCDDLEAMSTFFGQSCLPGNWSADPDFDTRLKQDYSSFCSLCSHGCFSSGSENIYLGYEGSLRCLTEGGADIAFTKKAAVDKFFNKREDISEFRLLCLDGTKVLLNESCFWGARPTNVYGVLQGRSQEIKDVLAYDLMGAFNSFQSKSPKPTWYGRVFPSSPDVTHLQVVSKSYMQYLAEGKYDVTIERPMPESCRSEVVRICTTSDVETDKCEDLRAAAFASSLRPRVACVQASGGRKGCMAAVKNGEADIITLDGGDVFTGSKHFNLEPILSEIYTDSSVAYYSVAVIHANSTIGSLADLKGKKSCHTGYGRMAGWNSPIGLLAEKGFLKKTGCELTNEVAAFFSSSCAPGAPKPSTLCSNCQGNGKGESVCESGDREIFNGYTGAFRCLASGSGDVAFVKHTTVPQNTDGQSQADWAKRLNSTDYRLLCPDDRVLPVDQYELCYWNLIPSHQVMTSDDKSSQYKKSVIRFLVEVAKQFGPKSSTFRLFGSYQNTRDLLFKDTVTGLRPLPPGSTGRSVLGDLYERLDKIDCKKF